MTGYPATYGALYSDTYDPPFPASPLGTEVDLYLGAWTDITDYVYQRDPMVITSGRPDQSSTLNPSQATMTWDNRDSRFSINNPSGPYAGLLVRNTPTRISVPNSLRPSPGNTAYLRMEDDAVSYASCPAATRIELTGSLDIRVDAELSGYGTLTLASMWGAASGVDQRCWRFGMQETGALVFEYTTSGAKATIAVGESASQTPPPLGRLTYRVTLDATTGTIAFYYGPGGAIDTGPWTQITTSLAVPAPGSAVTVFASTSTALTVGYSAGIFYDFPTEIAPNGAFYDMELRSGIGGTVVARGGFNARMPGATSWIDTAGNTWSLSGTAEISNRWYRYHGELAQTPKAADPSVTDVYSQVTVSGVLRRIQQAQSPLNSPMYRALVRLTGTLAPVAYWPGEDGQFATQLASALAGGSPMSANGTPQMASNSSFACSAAIPVVNGATFGATVPPAASWSAHVLRFLIQVPSGGESDGAVVASLFTTGIVARLDVVYRSAAGGTFTVNGYSVAGATLFSGTGITFSGLQVNGQAGRLEMLLQPSGGSVFGSATAIPVGATESGTTAVGTTGSLGVPTRVALNPNGTLTGTAFGHISIQSSYDGGLLNEENPLQAWAGEAAADRFLRLCTEEGIPARVYGYAAGTTPLGAQTIDTLANNLQLIETSDRGLLYEPTTCLGLGYRTPQSLCNQAPTATVSYTAQQLGPAWTPTTDDLLTINDVTATNIDGSSARVELASGAMSVQSPPNGIGRVNTQVQVSVAADGQLGSVAQWVLHVSTDSHDRFPVVPFNLARPQTGFAVATLRAGDLLVVENPPSWVQADEIDQLAAGFTETLGPFGVWEIDVNGIPAYPYTTGVIAPALSSASSFTGSGQFATHFDTDGSTLANTVSATATVLSFTSLPGYPPWTPQPQDYPFDVNIAGERVTVLGPGVCLGSDPFLANGAADYSAQQGSLSVTTSVGAPGVMTGYSVQALLVTPAGSPDTYATVIGVVSAAGSVAVNTGYTLWAWVLATQAGRSLELFANWCEGASYVSTSTTAASAVLTAGAWTLITGTVTSPSSGINAAQLGVNDPSSPTSADTFAVIGLNGAATSTISSSSPQQVTVKRSVNGVAKRQLGGTALSLWYPYTIGLG